MRNLILNGKLQRRSRRGFGGPKFNRPNYQQHGNKLNEDLHLIDDEKVFVFAKVPIGESGPFSIDDLNNKGSVRILENTNDGDVVIFIESKNALNEIIATYTESTRRDRELRYDVFDNIDSFSYIPFEDLIEESLQTDLENNYIEIQAISVEFYNLSFTSEHINEFRNYLTENDINFDSARLTDTYTFYIDIAVQRILEFNVFKGIRCITRIKGLAHDPVGEPSEYEPQEYRIMRKYDNIETVGLIDSGVLSSHPLLNGNIINEITKIPYNPSLIDQTGHGTGIAGGIIYGDIKEGLDNGELVKSANVVSYKIFDGTYDELFSNERTNYTDIQAMRTLITKLREIVQDAKTNYNVRIFSLALGMRTPSSKINKLSEAIDNLSKEENVLFVLPTGNCNIRIDNRDFQNQINDPNAILDSPSQALNGITTSSHIKDYYGAYSKPRHYGGRDYFEGISNKKNMYAPYSRVGREILDYFKPDLTDFGGNAVFETTINMYIKNEEKYHQYLLNHNYNQDSKLLRKSHGTSFTVPLIINKLCQILNHFPDISLQMAETILLHSASHNDIIYPISEKIIPETTPIEKQANKIVDESMYMLYGHGIPKINAFFESRNNFVNIIKEDTFIKEEDKNFIFYRLPISNFSNFNKHRYLKVTVGYKSHTRVTRKEYVGEKFDVQVFFKDQSIGLDEYERINLLHDTLGAESPISKSKGGHNRFKSKKYLFKRAKRINYDYLYVKVSYSKKSWIDDSECPFTIAISLYTAENTDFYSEVSNELRNTIAIQVENEVEINNIQIEEEI